MATVQCIKCEQEKPALANPPFRAGTKLGDLGAEIQQKVCADCYKEWITLSVKLVNEFRIDTTDPRGQAFWLQQMKLYLNLEVPDEDDPFARLLNQRVDLVTTTGVHARATLVGLDAERLNLAEFEGAGVPEGFDAGAAQGSASIARAAVRSLERASA